MAAVLAAVLVFAAALPTAAGGQRATVTPAFGGDCEAVLLRAVSGARREILVAAYSFSRRAIAEALVARAAAGVRVRVKMDARQAASAYSRSALACLREAGIEPELITMPEHRHMHHKFMVIDRREVVTGSYNFTTAATEDNWENLVVLSSVPVAEAYSAEWQRIASVHE